MPLISVPDSVDLVISFLPIPVFMMTWVIMGNIAHGTKDQSRRFYRWLGVGIAAALFLPNFFLCNERRVAREMLEWECTGTVLEKYRSSNHDVYSIFVNGERTARLEGLTKEFWEQVKVGDAVAKEKWNRYALLNGFPVRIVQDRG